MAVNLVLALFLRGIACKLAVIFPHCLPCVCCSKTATTPFSWSTGAQCFSRMKQLNVKSCQPAQLPAQVLSLRCYFVGWQTPPKSAASGRLSPVLQRLSINPVPMDLNLSQGSPQGSQTSPEPESQLSQCLFLGL